MKTAALLPFVVLFLASAPAKARCVGPDMMRSCTDRNGNVEQIQRTGNTTTIHGFNAKTGEHWHRSATLGEPSAAGSPAAGSPAAGSPAAEKRAAAERAAAASAKKEGARPDGWQDPLGRKCNQFGCY